MSDGNERNNFEVLQSKKLAIPCIWQQKPNASIWSICRITHTNSHKSNEKIITNCDKSCMPWWRRKKPSFNALVHHVFVHISHSFWNNFVLVILVLSSFNLIKEKICYFILLWMLCLRLGAWFAQGDWRTSKFHF